MRADAALNRVAILIAARDLFAEQGTGVALEAVAERAGVGVATLYRRFPDRDALVHAVGVEILATLENAAREALDGEVADAWRRFATAAAEARIGAVASALAPAKHQHLRADPEAGAARERMVKAVTKLVTTCQRAGAIRDDVSPREALLALIVVTRPFPNLPPDVSASLLPRMLALLESALRPGGEPLPGSARTVERGLREAVGRRDD